jgi:hypothetical protein
MMDAKPLCFAVIVPPSSFASSFLPLSGGSIFSTGLFCPVVRIATGLRIEEKLSEEGVREELEPLRSLPARMSLLR